MGPGGVGFPQVLCGGMYGVGGALGSAQEVGPRGRRWFISASSPATAVASYDCAWDRESMPAATHGVLKQSQGVGEGRLPSVPSEALPFLKASALPHSHAFTHRHCSSLHPHGRMGAFRGHRGGDQEDGVVRASAGGGPSGHLAFPHH